jgi:hypothetical protein
MYLLRPSAAHTATIRPNEREMVTEPVDVGDQFDYDPPEVIWRPILTEGEVTGYKVDPPFEEWDNGDNLITLRHYAALIEHRTGMKVRVAPNGHQSAARTQLQEIGAEIISRDEGQLFDVLTGHATGGPAPYEVTWSWLSGFECGHNEILWSVSKKKEEK